MERNQILSPENCQFDFKMYRPVGYICKPDEIKRIHFEDGRYLDVKKRYCVVSLNDYERFVDENNPENNFEVIFVDIKDGKFDITNEIITANYNDLRDLSQWEIL